MSIRTLQLTLRHFTGRRYLFARYIRPGNHLVRVRASLDEAFPGLGIDGSKLQADGWPVGINAVMVHEAMRRLRPYSDAVLIGTQFDCYIDSPSGYFEVGDVVENVGNPAARPEGGSFLDPAVDYPGWLIVRIGSGSDFTDRKYAVGDRGNFLYLPPTAWSGTLPAFSLRASIPGVVIKDGTVTIDQAVFDQPERVKD